MSKQCSAIPIAALSDGPFGSMFGRWLYIISVSAWASMSHVRSRNLKTRAFYPISIDTPEARWTTMDKLKKLGIRFVMVSSRAILFDPVSIGGPRQLITRDCKYWLRWQMEPKNDTIRIPPCLKRNGSLPIVGNQSKSRPSPSRCWMFMFGNRRTQQVCVHSTARRAGLALQSTCDYIRNGNNKILVSFFRTFIWYVHFLSWRWCPQQWSESRRCKSCI